MNSISLTSLSLLLSVYASMAVASVELTVAPVLNDHTSIDYGSSVSPDGSKMYFTHAGEGFSTRTLMVASLENGQIVSREPLQIGGKTIAGGDVQISPDGQTITFCSEMAIERDPTRTDRDLFYATKTSHGWSAANRFPDVINTESSEFYPVLTTSGNLYFSRANEDTSMDVYVSELVGGEYQQAKKLNANINTDLLESDAYISPDEQFMVFVRMYEEGAYGVSDMYLSLNRNGEWSSPINLANPFNFAGVDGSPFVTQDKKWLYFTSNRNAPDPTEFDAHLGVFRVPFMAVYQRMRDRLDSPKTKNSG